MTSESPSGQLNSQSYPAPARLSSTSPMSSSMEGQQQRTTSSTLSPSSHQVSSLSHSQSQHQISSIQPVQQNTASSQEFCLRWNNYQTNLTCVFDQLLQNESFVDVTLACDGHSIKAHKMVLSACSPYFQALFFDNPCQHPIIIMRDVKWPELKAVVEFMYKGEINVNQDQIGPLLRVAEMLKIRGLADVNQDHDLESNQSAPPPPPPTTTSSNQSRQIIPAITTTSTGSSTNISNASHNNNNNNNMNNNPPPTSSSTAGGNTNNNSSSKKSNVVSRDWGDIVDNMETNVMTTHARANNSNNNRESGGSSGGIMNEMGRESGTRGGGPPSQKKRKWHMTDTDNHLGGHETPDHLMQSASPLQNHPLNASSTPIPNSSLIQPPTTPTPHSNFSIPPPSLESMGISALGHPDDLEIKPGIAEMIREEERAKLMENSHPWLGASTSSLADYSSLLKLKSPTWTQQQLREAIYAVITQKMRFTQAAARYNIPKGTLYDNILGKSHRMQVLEEAGLDASEENAVLEFCCDVSVSPYNRRTRQSLASILDFVAKLKKSTNAKFDFKGKSGFRWWWAFCKKYSIVSLHYESSENKNKIKFKNAKSLKV